MYRKDQMAQHTERISVTPVQDFVLKLLLQTCPLFRSKQIAKCKSLVLWDVNSLNSLKIHPLPL